MNRTSGMIAAAFLVFAVDGAAQGQAPESGAAWMMGTVQRALFTSAVEDREPVDQLRSLDPAAEYVYFYTELRDMAGQVATHRWKHDGEVVSEVSFEINGPRWRVWSRKRLPAEPVGTWEVTVINQTGDLLLKEAIGYGR